MEESFDFDLDFLGQCHQPESEDPVDMRQLAQRIAETDGLVRTVKSLEAENQSLKQKFIDLNDSATKVQSMYSKEHTKVVDLNSKNVELSNRLKAAQEKVANLEGEAVQKALFYHQLDEESKQNVDDEKSRYDQLEKRYKIVCEKFMQQAKLLSDKGMLDVAAKKDISEMKRYLQKNNIEFTVFTSPKKRDSNTTSRMVSRGTQYTTSTTTRSACTSAFIKQHHVGTNFPEFVPISIEDIFRETLVDIPSPIEAICDTPNPVNNIGTQTDLDYKVETTKVSFGTCTDLCNVQKELDFVRNKQPPSGWVKRELLHDKIVDGKPQLSDLWELLGQTIFALIGDGSGSISTAHLEDFSQQMALFKNRFKKSDKVNSFHDLQQDHERLDNVTKLERNISTCSSPLSGDLNALDNKMTNMVAQPGSSSLVYTTNNMFECLKNSSESSSLDLAYNSNPNVNLDDDIPDELMCDESIENNSHADSKILDITKQMETLQKKLILISPINDRALRSRSLVRDSFLQTRSINSKENGNRQITGNGFNCTESTTEQFEQSSYYESIPETKNMEDVICLKQQSSSRGECSKEVGHSMYKLSRLKKSSKCRKALLRKPQSRLPIKQINTEIEKHDTAKEESHFDFPSLNQSTNFAHLSTQITESDMTLNSSSSQYNYNENSNKTNYEIDYNYKSDSNNEFFGSEFKREPKMKRRSLESMTDTKGEYLSTSGSPQRRSKICNIVPNEMKSSPFEEASSLVITTESTAMKCQRSSSHKPNTTTDSLSDKIRNNLNNFDKTENLANYSDGFSDDSFIHEDGQKQRIKPGLLQCIPISKPDLMENEDKISLPICSYSPQFLNSSKKIENIETKAEEKRLEIACRTQISENFRSKKTLQRARKRQRKDEMKTEFDPHQKFNNSKIFAETEKIKEVVSNEDNVLLNTLQSSFAIPPVNTKIILSKLEKIEPNSKSDQSGDEDDFYGFTLDEINSSITPANSDFSLNSESPSSPCTLEEPSDDYSPVEIPLEKLPEYDSDYSPKSPRHVPQNYEIVDPILIPLHRASYVKRKKNLKHNGMKNSILGRYISRYDSNKRRLCTQKARSETVAEGKLLWMLRKIIERYTMSTATKVECEKCTRRLVKLCAKDTKLISTAILEVVEDTIEDTSNELTPPSTILTESHQKILVLIKNLNRYIGGYERRLLFILDQRIFNLKSDSIKLDALMNLTMLYISIIDTQNFEKNSALLFIYKSLYYYTRKSYPMICYALTTYPGILPGNDDLDYDKSNPLISTIQCILNCQKYDMNNIDFKHREVFHILRMYYKYDIAKPTREEVVANLLGKIRVGKLRNINYCFALLCKRGGTEWCLKYVINDHLIPLLREYTNQLVETDLHDGKVACLLDCLSSVLKPFPVKFDMSGYRQIFVSILYKTERQVVQEASVLAILRTSRFSYVDCFNQICRWNPSYKISKSLHLIIVSFVHRKPLQKLQNFGNQI